MNNRKKVSLLMASVMVLSVAAGCSKSDDKKATSSSPSASASASAAPTISSEPVTLKFAINFTWLGEGELQKYFVDPVKKKYPNITLEFLNMSLPETTLDKLVAAGNIPDIVQSANSIIYQFTDPGLADNIEPLIKKYNFDTSKLSKAAVDSVKIASGLDYLSGLPWTMHFNATYYNKDIFDKFGVSYPKDGMTWDDYRELARKLTRNEGGVQYRGLEPDVPSRMASVLGYNLVDGKTNKATLNNDGWKKVFTYIKSVYDIPGNEKFVWVPSSNNQFMKDKTLAMLPQLNLIPNFKDVKDLNWDMAQFPQFPEKPNTGMMVDEWILHVTKQSKYKDQAFQVLSTVLSEEVQSEIARSARFPILSGPKVQEEFGKNIDYLKGKNLAAAFKTTPAPAMYASKIASFGQAASQAAFMKYMKEGVDLNTALQQADEEANQKIQAATK